MDELRGTTTTEELLPDPLAYERVDEEEIPEELSVQAARFARLCWKRRKLIAGITFTGIAVCLLYAVTRKNIYAANTTLMPPGDSSPLSSMIGMLSNPAATMTTEALGLDTPGELFVKILESRNVEDGLVGRFNLKSHYKTRTDDDTRKVLASSTSVSSDLKSGVITVSVKDTNPQFAANLANGYVQELNRVVSDDSTSSARRERLFLEERLKQVKQELDESSLALSQFSSKSKTVDPSSQVKSMIDEGAKLEAELIEARSQLAGLRQTYSEENSRVKAAEANIGELESQIGAMSGLSKPSSSTADAGNSPYPTVAALPSLGVTYADLDRRVKVDEAVWDTLTRQYEAAKVEEVKEVPTVRVLDAAIAPERKDGPHRSLILLIGAFLSLGVALAVVAGLDAWHGMSDQSEPKRVILEIARFAKERRSV